MKSLSFYSLLAMMLVALANPNQLFSQNEIDPVQFLKEGNIRFVSQQATHQHQDLKTIESLAKAQHPKCIIVSCSDSRVPTEIIFDQGIGDIFSIRTAGNVMSDYEEGSIEYAVEHLHTPTIVVLGHIGCGAIQAFLNSVDATENEHLEEHKDHISKIIETISNEEEQKELVNTIGKDANLSVIANVIHGVHQLRNSDPILKPAFEKGELNIIGAIYHIDSGKVEFLDI